MHQQPHGRDQYFSTPHPKSEKRVNLSGPHPLCVQQRGRQRVWLILFDGERGEAANDGEEDGF
jgi:hypothetical protein